VIGRDLGLELPRRKPLGVPRINPQHPLARGLTFATLLTGDGVPRDLVLGRRSTSGPTALRNTPQGQAALFNGSSDACNFGDIASYRTGSQNFTVMAYANPPASSTTFGLASKRNGSSFVQVSFAVNMDNNGGPVSGLLGLFMLDGSNQLSGATTTSPVNGAYHQFVATRNSATTLQFYVDGVSQPLNYTLQQNANYAATDPLFIGAMGSTSAPAGGYLPGSIGYVYIWRGRVLTASEINWLYRDPYVFVREQPRQEPWLTIWVPSAGGGTTVNPNAIATAEAVYGPTVTLQVLPGTIATGATVYAPTVSVGALAGQVIPNAIPTAEQVYAPTLTLQLLPGVITTGEQVYAPFVALLTPQTIQPGTITTLAQVYAPVYVGFTMPPVQPDGIPSAATAYPPTVIVLSRSQAPSLVLVASSGAPLLVVALTTAPPSLTVSVPSGAPELVPVA
jgi:hypothetical protein